MKKNHFFVRYRLTSMLALLMSCFSMIAVYSGEDLPMSQTTSLSPKDSEMLFENDDAARYRCPGVAAYQVLYDQAHGRSWVNLVYDSEETDLMSALFEACPGTWQNVVGNELFWRGEREGEEFIPYALIVPMASVPDESKPDETEETWVVVQAAGAGSHVVGHVLKAQGGLKAAVRMADKLCRLQ